ncbi:hypothetical protein D3C71_1155870 [compost metagenome]
MLLQRGGAGEHHRQLKPRAVARVKERQREVGQVILHRQGLAAQAHHTAACNVHPQRAVGRLFADVGVVPDKLQTQLVEIADQPSVQGHFRLYRLTQLAVADRNDIHQCVIEEYAQMREGRQQRWRGSETQIQFCITSQPIPTHLELVSRSIADAGQHDVLAAAQVSKTARTLPRPSLPSPALRLHRRGR